ncbi:MAG: hypothetical protein Q9M46_00675, partial [Ghiorsea sp.]|nr:hypothetical protein [Ghiorsea sp.]
KEQSQQPNSLPFRITRLAAGGEVYRQTLTCQHVISNAYFRHQKQQPNRPKSTTENNLLQNRFL